MFSVRFVEGSPNWLRWRFGQASSPKHKTRNTQHGFAFALLVCFNLPLGRASAQTTQPSLDAWQTYVSSITDALVADGKTDALAQLIPDAAEISQFDSRETETRFRLAHRVNHMTVLWQHAYAAVPAAMVSDLSTELPADVALPAELRKKLLPKDSAALPKADAIAQKWVARVIGPDVPAGLSVVLFWDRPAADVSPAAAPREPVFVLIKAAPSLATPTVSRIRYGDMSQALNE